MTPSWDWPTWTWCMSLEVRGSRSTRREPTRSRGGHASFTRTQDLLIAEALQAFVDEAESRVGHSVEKKASIIPRCDVGERCAMKHGPRFGRLCDCLRGAACNTFFLRCY
ncbi:cocaine- and amphetamine-regulated transcript 4 isoform X4 [Nerophis ophidion]|uniref:cocaine- and amphetamine-regulated transcript 4 isoform X4 n=1 Tax=Nerophis ophidion TaxID=159077 RepID=UPI002ADF682B|nr:cocaine- and amphetamine-regulated transcript 4 isoform X4 [Nerophis ophidion]